MIQEPIFSTQKMPICKINIKRENQRLLAILVTDPTKGGFNHCQFCISKIAYVECHLPFKSNYHPGVCFNIEGHKSLSSARVLFKLWKSYIPHDSRSVCPIPMGTIRSGYAARRTDLVYLIPFFFRPV